MRNGTTLIEHLDAVGEMGRRVARGEPSPAA
jgi:hypothetical protein